MLGSGIISPVFRWSLSEPIPSASFMRSKGGPLGRVDPTNRRAFLSGLAGAALGAAAPLRAAQAQGVPVVGFLSSGAGPDSADLAAASRCGLEEAGYVPDRNVT